MNKKLAERLDAIEAHIVDIRAQVCSQEAALIALAPIILAASPLNFAATAPINTSILCDAKSANSDLVIVIEAGRAGTSRRSRWFSTSRNSYQR